MNELEKIRTELIDGDEDTILGYVEEALQEQMEPKAILEQGLLPGMNDIADKWAAGEAFIPEVLIGAKIMNAAMERLEWYYVKKTDTDLRASGDSTSYTKDFLRFLP